MLCLSKIRMVQDAKVRGVGENERRWRNRVEQQRAPWRRDTLTPTARKRQQMSCRISILCLKILPKRLQNFHPLRNNEDMLKVFTLNTPILAQCDYPLNPTSFAPNSHKFKPLIKSVHQFGRHHIIKQRHPKKQKNQEKKL